MTDDTTRRHTGPTPAGVRWNNGGITETLRTHHGDTGTNVDSFTGIDEVHDEVRDEVEARNVQPNSTSPRNGRPNHPAPVRSQ